MIRHRIAAQTRCFPEPIRKALHTAAVIGCHGVQFNARTELRPQELSDTGARQLQKILVDLNLRVGSIAFPTRRGFATPADLDRRVEAALEAMRLASRLGARVMVVNLRDLPDGPESASWETLTDVVERLAAVGNRLGVRLAAQVGDVDPQTVNSFLSSLPEGSLGIDLYPPDSISAGRAPAEFVKLLGPHIVHVHAVDAVRDLSQRAGVEVELGRGTADFVELLGALEEFGYEGWLTVERSRSPNVVEEMGNAVAYLRSL